MTSFNPRLAVSRMIVKRNSDVVYDAQFHAGLNIISGENSSGKSTILDFLFYGLGGDLSDWREAALACSEVIIEVELNGHLAVFAREISETSGRPMRIFLGSLQEAQHGSGAAGWSIYPYRRSPSKESFSQAIFQLLGMPEVAGDANSNVTMHQMLRLLYADQLSPVDRIFRLERFDTALTRQTVGDMLCGAYDNVLYQRQLRLREAEREYGEATSEWRAAVKSFSNAEQSLTLEWVDAERSKLNKELKETHALAEELEERIFHAEMSDGLTIREQEELYKEVSDTQERLLELRGERDAIQLEVSDSDKFIAALKAKLEQLRDAEVTADTLKGISFLHCPSCFAPVAEPETDHACSLCKSPFDIGRAQSRILSIINQTGIQVRQSELLQRERLDELERLGAEIIAVASHWSGLSERYRLINRLPSTELRAEARKLYGRAGYLERQLEDLGQKSAIVERIDALSRVRAALNEEMGRLREQIEAAERRQDAQIRRAYTSISRNTVAFLRNDLQRQDTFSKAESVSFDFADDRLSVSGESFFSASSMVYLRNSFFAAFLASSLQDSNFRHPRFLLLDTIEDKGMEPERSHRFQNLLADMSHNSDVDHQLIYATAMISPRLAGTAHIVDRVYTHEDRTLRLHAN